MDILLNTIWKVWITVGPLVLVGFLFIVGMAQGKCFYVVLVFIVFCEGIALLTGGDQSILGILIEKVITFYDKNKDTATFLKIVESNPQNIGQIATLAFYCTIKYLVKALIYCVILHGVKLIVKPILLCMDTNHKYNNFGGYLKIIKKDELFFTSFLKKMRNWFTAMSILCVLGIWGYGLGTLIKYEGPISVFIWAICSIKDKSRHGYSMPSYRIALGVGHVVAFFYALDIEAGTWRKLDEIVFNCILA